MRPSAPAVRVQTSEGRAPRILFLVNDAAFFLSHRLPLAIAAREAGMEVHVATSADSAAQRIATEGLAFHAVEVSRSGINPWQELRTFVDIVRLLSKMRPDILHTVTIKPVLYGGIAARLTRQKAVVSAIPGLGTVFIERGIGAAIRRYIIKWGYRRALRHPKARVIFQNCDDLDTFRRERLVDRTTAVLIPGSGVDLERFVASPFPSGTPIIMLCSRMLWDKGVGEFVAAAKQLRQEGVNARFVLVGESDPGNRSAVPKAKLNEWHLSGEIEWWGRQEDMPAVLGKAWAVCLPSYREGMPKVLLEAAACARPIVATDVPGCRHAVRNGETGILVPPRRVPELAGAIRRLIEDRELAVQMGSAGRSFAESSFALPEVVSRTVNLYRGLLA